MRPIDADAMSKSIAEGIRLAEEWEKEATEKNDECGIRYATNTYNNLLAMLHRVQEQPTIESEKMEHNLLPFSKRIGLSKEFEKWAEYNGVANCPESVIAFLLINNLLDIDACYEYLSKLSTAEKHCAKWIPREYDGYADGLPVWDLWECSHCGHEHIGTEDTLTAYCPDCGYDMYGGENHVGFDEKE